MRATGSPGHPDGGPGPARPAMTPPASPVTETMPGRPGPNPANLPRSSTHEPPPRPGRRTDPAPVGPPGAPQRRALRRHPPLGGTTGDLEVGDASFGNLAADVSYGNTEVLGEARRHLSSPRTSLAGVATRGGTCCPASAPPCRCGRPVPSSSPEARPRCGESLRCLPPPRTWPGPLDHGNMRPPAPDRPRHTETRPAAWSTATTAAPPPRGWKRPAAAGRPTGPRRARR